jgi:amidase
VNPAAPERVPGGSSSGSAVVVARGDVDFALGTDTGGSVRVPASHTGVLGLRPTHAAISSQGVLPLAPRFDTVGIFARDAGTLERAAGALLKAPRSVEAPSRLLGLRELLPLLDSAAQSTFEPAARALADALGVAFEWAELPPPAPAVADWLSTYLTLQNLEAASLHRTWLEQERPALGSLIARRVGGLLATSPGAGEAAEIARLRLVRALAELRQGGAWLVLPSAPGAAPYRGSEDDAIEAYTGRALTLAAPASLAGLPQLSLPLLSVEGCPLGVSLVGAPGADRALLSAARQALSRLLPLGVSS